MPIFSRGLHHFHLRKRIHQNLEEYPHPDRLKRIMDKLVYVAGLLGPIMTLPQLKMIWIDHMASGVSVISWGTYTVTAIFWVIYGVIHQDKPIIITYSLWFFINGMVTLGVILYS